MLIEFRVSNYRSIGEEQVLSLVPAPKQKEHPDNIIRNGKHEALNVVAIYGANASGKSNLLKAMGILDSLVNVFGHSSTIRRLPYDPFLLRESWDEKSTSCEITFVIAEHRYRYGFEFDQSGIISEWLFRKSVGREVNLFQRSRDIIDVSSGLIGSARVIDAAIEATRPNALFLSTCDSFNIKEPTDILQWFANYIVIDGLNTAKDVVKTVKLFQDERYRKKIKDYFDEMDFDIVDLQVNSEELYNGDLIYEVLSSHYIYDKKGVKTNALATWKMEDKESSGTRKSFDLCGAVLWTLDKGGVLIIDEVEASMHPKMTLYLINMFLNKAININNAQFIFATHDTNLLSYADLRRDQIYFAEKNEWESTGFYSLSDFVYLDKNGSNLKSTKERPDTDKEKRYFEGRYGAVPILGDFNPMRVKENGKER